MPDDGKPTVDIDGYPRELEPHPQEREARRREAEAADAFKVKARELRAALKAGDRYQAHVLAEVLETMAHATKLHAAWMLNDQMKATREKWRSSRPVEDVELPEESGVGTITSSDGTLHGACRKCRTPVSLIDGEWQHTTEVECDAHLPTPGSTNQGDTP